MELTIHLYGYAYHMFNTLNAIAMFRNSTFYPAAINTIALMVTAYYAIKMSGSRAEGEWRQYLLKIGGMIVLINALLLPKTSMNIKDHVEKNFWRVDNIPLAFALPIGMIEELGHLITIGFEQAFSTVKGRSAFNYYHHGTVFGVRLAKEVMQAHVRRPEYISNMRGFIERCVVLPAMIGQQFTKEELIATKDMWGLVSTNAGSFTRTPMIINGVKQEPAPTCKQAVPYFEKIMEQSADTDITDISIKLRAAGVKTKYNPSHIDKNNALREQILALYNNKDISVENILKHNMMINSLNHYRAAKYPAVKAQLQHEATGFLSGDMANKVLTGMQAVIKNIIYGSFIFVLPLMLFAGGMGKYKGWINICLSLQLWPPLFAMLNMMIDTAYDPVHIVSYSAWSTTVKEMDSIASIAANLTLLIPILAVYITRMGEGGFLHIAGSLMAANQNAVGAAAAEQSSGGMSYDNQSINNRNRSNVSENKYDNSRQFVSGINSGINPDGSMEKILPNGQVITVAGAGTTSSVGESSYRDLEGVNSSINERRSDETQMVNSEAASLVKAKESLVTKEASALTTIAENTRTDSGYNIDTSTDEGKEVVKALNAIDEKTKDSKYTWQQNAEAHLKSDVTLGGKIAQFFGVDIGIGGSISASNSSEQQDSSSSRVSNDLNTVDRTSTNTRSSNHEAWLKSVGIDKTQQDSIRESYSETARLEKSIAVHKDNIEAYNKALDYTKNNGSEFTQDMTQEVINSYRDTYGVSDRQAELAVRMGGEDAQRIFREVSRHKADAVLQQVKSVETKLNKSDSINNFISDNTSAVNSNPGAAGGVVDDFRQEQNMIAQEQAVEQIGEREDNLARGHNKKIYDSSLEFDKAHNKNSEMYKQRQIDIDTHEENRIGKGMVAKAFGTSVDYMSFKNAGDNIGRPLQKDDHQLNIVRPTIDKSDSKE